MMCRFAEYICMDLLCVSQMWLGGIPGAALADWLSAGAPLLMQLVGTLMSMPEPMAAPWMSCSFLTVSLPMCSSLETWSSTLGISTLPAVLVRRVAT